MIPEHCIKYFEADYGSYPSHTKICMSEEIFKKLVSRSDLRWCRHSIRGNEDIMESSLHSFHETGIYIYLDEIRRTQIGASTKKINEYEVYFMFKIDKKHIVDFTINQIIKEMKNGNYGGRTETEN